MAAAWDPHPMYSTSDDNLPAVLLLHGYGSHEGDLAGLSSYLPAQFRYIALRGPLETGPGFAWFPLTMHGARLAATGAKEAAQAVADWCAQVDIRPVGAIGFSQGGALSLELLREGAPGTIAWSGVLSGFVVGAEDAAVDDRDTALAVSKPPVFWGRGDMDGVIPEERVSATSQWLSRHAQLVERVYPGLMHSVSADEIAELSEWMLTVTDARESSR